RSSQYTNGPPRASGTSEMVTAHFMGSPMCCGSFGREFLVADCLPAPQVNIFNEPTTPILAEYQERVAVHLDVGANHRHGMPAETRTVPQVDAGGISAKRARPQLFPGLQVIGNNLAVIRAGPRDVKHILELNENGLSISGEGVNLAWTAQHGDSAFVGAIIRR